MLHAIPDFRGGNAPASLKRDTWSPPYGPTIRTFPGWKRPGLIEASSSRRAHLWLSKFPGWKRPGLIEATFASTVLYYLLTLRSLYRRPEQVEGRRPSIRRAATSVTAMNQAIVRRWDVNYFNYFVIFY